MKKLTLKRPCKPQENSYDGTGVPKRADTRHCAGCQYKTGLMLAYMNEESLQKAWTKAIPAFTAAAETLWKKRETSGHVQKIRAIKTDCDRDTLLIEVEQEGPACHTGSPSCFETLQVDAGEEDTFTYEKLYDKLMGRKRDLPENSYTTYLFEKGLDKILKKWAKNARKSSSQPKTMTGRK